MINQIKEAIEAWQEIKGKAMIEQTDLPPRLEFRVDKDVFKQVCDYIPVNYQFEETAIKEENIRWFLHPHVIICDES